MRNPEKKEEIVLKIIQENPKISTSKIAELSKIHYYIIEKVVNNLKKQRRIREIKQNYEISYWIVSKNANKNK